jgi:CspA family cold shock protein
MTGPERRRGVVVEFDEAVGLGWIEPVNEGAAPAAGKSPARYLFHCTQIADGTRTIPAGAAVSFVVVAGHGGQWQAARIRPDR